MRKYDFWFKLQPPKFPVFLGPESVLNREKVIMWTVSGTVNPQAAGCGGDKCFQVLRPGRRGT